MYCGNRQPTHPPCSLPFKADLCGASEPSGFHLGSASGSPKGNQREEGEGDQGSLPLRLPEAGHAPRLKVSAKGHSEEGHSTQLFPSRFSNLTPSSGPFSARRAAAKPTTSPALVHYPLWCPSFINKPSPSYPTFKVPNSFLLSS